MWMERKVLESLFPLLLLFASFPNAPPPTHPPKPSPPIPMLTAFHCLRQTHCSCCSTGPFPCVMKPARMFHALAGFLDMGEVEGADAGAQAAGVKAHLMLILSSFPSMLCPRQPSSVSRATQPLMSFTTNTLIAGS